MNELEKKLSIEAVEQYYDTGVQIQMMIPNLMVGWVDGEKNQSKESRLWNINNGTLYRIKPTTFEGCSMSWNEKPIPVFTPEELAAIRFDSLRALEMFYNEKSGGDKIRQSIINKINNK